MAETAFTLADETIAWLEIRETFRFEQRAAYLGTPDIEEDPQPETPEAPEGITNQRATDFACEVVHNNYFTLINPGMYQDETATYGWPPAQALIDSLLAQLNSATDRPQYSEVVRKQLQVNALESFRRTLLHQRQRRVHLLRHQQQVFLAEPQAQAELEALLQNVKVGQTAAPAQ